MRSVWAAGAAIVFSATCPARAAGPSPAVVELPTIDILATTPLSGGGVDVQKYPGAVTTLDSSAIERQRSPNVVKSLAQQTPSIDVQDVTGNGFQPDVYFRGFDASPVSGTPQGLAIYQNGVRINEAFGDVVNWDLIPTAAIRTIDVIGANPIYGLNALGGALNIQMKDGFTYQGASLDLMGGSFGRAQTSLQWGKQVGPWGAYIAIEGAHDGGYRKFSASDIRRVYGDIGYKSENAEFHLNMGAANNNFGATAAAPAELLAQGWSNVYTTPQSSNNQVGYLNTSANLTLTPTWSLQSSAHLRSYFQTTVDGNSTDVQPCADPTLLCFNDPAVPANGLTGAQLANPFDPAATLGEIDRTHTQTTSAGATLQATNTDRLFGHDNRLVFGASFDYGVTNFGATAELGTINPDFSVAGSGLFLGPSGDPVSDGPVSLRSANAYTGLYALDAFDLTKDLTVTAGGRYNIAKINLQDQLGTALNGSADYSRFNPLIGATYKFSPELSAYASYSEANRAPTPLELGCADPAHPCILASFLVSDPPLKQVVARTYEAGLRGSHGIASVGTVGWKLGAFRTDSENDILDVPDPVQQGFGYFQNVGATRRQGIEAQVDFKSEKLRLSASYAYLDATFRNALPLGSNSPFAVDGVISIQAGDAIPMIPHHRAKFSADYSVTSALTIGADLIVVGPQYFAGDGSNQFPQLPAYAVVNADASYQVTSNIQVYLKCENLFDNRYATYGAFFDTTQVPNFANGGAPFSDPRSLNPAQPRSVYAGMKATF